jgi:hypothetical protein
MQLEDIKRQTEVAPWYEYAPVGGIGRCCLDGAVHLGERRRRSGTALPSPSRAPLATRPRAPRFSSHSVISRYTSQALPQPVDNTLEIPFIKWDCDQFGERCAPRAHPVPESNSSGYKETEHKF